MPQLIITGTWYHGDANRRHGFHDQKMDRDANQDGNAMGPGIYFTRDYTQARSYAWPKGWIYTVNLRTPQSHVILAESQPSTTTLRHLIALAPADSRETGESNWDENPLRARELAIKAYGQSATAMDAILGIYHDFFGQRAEAFTQAMFKIGYTACLHRLPEVDHAVVYAPSIIQVVKEEAYL
jgi:hypothetical protein